MLSCEYFFRALHGIAWHCFSKSVLPRIFISIGFNVLICFSFFLNLGFPYASHTPPIRLPYTSHTPPIHLPSENLGKETEKKLFSVSLPRFSSAMTLLQLTHNARIRQENTPDLSRNNPGTPQARTPCMGATLSLGIDQVYTSLLWEQYRMPMGASWENSWLMLWYVQPHQMMSRRDRNETCTFHTITL